jgi:hypothetical protein
MNYLISHQCMVISLPGVDAFIKSPLYYPLGDDEYVNQVSRPACLPLYLWHQAPPSLCMCVVLA